MDLEENKVLDNKNFINGYENTKLIRYDELTND